MKLHRYLLVLFTAICLMASPADEKKKSTKESPKMTTAKQELIDVNSASADELKTLPGIGEAYSAKIVKNRPYNGKDDIVKKAGVPQATYEKIKDKIIAKQPKKK
jgi:competence protein ComEA